MNQPRNRAIRKAVACGLFCLLLLSMPATLAQTIDLRPDSSLSFTHHPSGLVQQRISSDLRLDWWLMLADISLDMDYIAEVNLTTVSLRVIDDLRQQVDALPPGTLKTDLQQTLDIVETAIDTIRAMADPVSIGALEDELEIIEDQLNDYFMDPIEEDVALPREKMGKLLAFAKPIEDRYDRLEYIASRVKLHSRDTVKPQLAHLLRKAVLHIADGNRAAYISILEELLVRVEGHRGTEIKPEEADRIRGRCDHLLRLIGESGSENFWRLNLSTTIAGLEFDGTFSWWSDQYRAPSNDMDTQDLEFEVGFDRSDWEIAMRYERNDRTNPDRLEHDDDRIINSLDLSLSHRTDHWDMTAAVLFDDTLFPNDIDDEIESDRVSAANQAIAGLIDEVIGLGLPAVVQEALMKELEDALAALHASDRRTAVAQLEDFIDEVYDAEWDGQVTPAAARMLINKTLDILPRQRIKQLIIPLSLDVPFYEGDLQIELEKKKILYPADSRLDREETTGELTYTRELSGAVLSGRGRQEKLTYQHDTAKNRRQQELEAEIVGQLGWGEITLALFQQETTYPHNAVRDRLVQTGDSTFALNLAALDLAVSLTERTTSYPNNPGRPDANQVDLAIDVSWSTGIGTFSAELNDQRRTTAFPLADDVLISERRNIQLSWNGHVTDDFEISLSMQWTCFIDWDEPDKDRTIITIDIGFDLAF